MPEFVRVYDPTNKVVHNWPKDASLDGLELIDGAPAADVYGNHFGAEYGVTRKPTAKQETAKAVADTKPEEAKK